tara:strand:+ start:2998 stop:4365 length:1368 start_codon:yes stop_codon:yes gene_type:complete
MKTWTTDRFYGTINHQGNAVLPKVNRLKTLRFPNTDDTSHFALDFVADAWYDFATRLRSLANENIIFRDSPWAKPFVVKGWEPVSDLYDEYMREEVYPRFVDGFMSTQNNDSKVRNIGSFINRLNEFIQNDISSFGPITLSGLVEARRVPVYASGLVIEIAEVPYDDDYAKGYQFIDANFGLVASIASEYGFSIDQNIPWRLVADLNNPAMIEYMIGVPLDKFDTDRNVEYECEPFIGGLVLPPRASGMSQIPGLEGVRRHVAYFNYKDNEGKTRREPGYRRYKRAVADTWSPRFGPDIPAEVFSSMYTLDFTETFYTDIDNFQQYLLDFYNYYVAIRPRAVFQKMVPVDSTCGPQTHSHFREQITKEEFESLYSDTWKLKTFYILRNEERQNKVSKARRRSSIQIALNFYNMLRIGNSGDPYRSALQNIQNRMIGPADTGPLTLTTVGDIIFSS